MSATVQLEAPLVKRQAPQIQPLRNMVLLVIAPQRPASALHVVQVERSTQRFTVLACGPEVRDVVPGAHVLANRLAATLIGELYLLPETAILATL